ncbi:uncharacterized protein LOC134825216 isoform X2 [Bolinopsis microptera]|uniref:uncharacterized protein LOC134825216 isoform X2 n=1 Tax=Bolinopsis microptera TaxID=2820187 RepID=UPI003078B689
MYISLILLLLSLLVKPTSSVTGFYTYQVAEEGDELKLYCLTSGQDIKWSRTVNGIKEELKAPTYQVSKSYRCGNPYMCGGYDVEETKVCLRSTLTLRGLQKSDSATYFCQEGVQKGAFSFAYVLTVFSSNAMPHIYDFEPLQCNNTDWYGCIATKNSARYEFFVQSQGDKTTLKGTYNEANITKIGDTDVRYLIRDNYIALHDFSILNQPEMKFGCRAFDRSGRFTEFATGKTFVDLEPPRSQDTYEAYLVKWIGVGVGSFAGLIIVIFVCCKLKKRCGRERRHSATYTGIDRQGGHQDL